MAAKDVLGRRGEDVAAAWLERTGLLVLDRNWRCSEGELDIVATDPVGAERVVVFCEVKTRSGDGYGSPFDAVTQGKRRKLRRRASGSGVAPDHSAASPKRAKTADGLARDRKRL